MGDTEYRVSTEPSALVGLDGQLRKDRLGARLTWRSLWANPYIPAAGGYQLLRIDQYGVEFQIQFGGARI